MGGLLLRSHVTTGTEKKVKGSFFEKMLEPLKVYVSFKIIYINNFTKTLLPKFD